ncbi:MAG: YaiI/YqxD family protein [Bacillota bacterium]
MRVLVDADACPVLPAIRRLCAEAGVPVITVASFRHEIAGENHIMVGPEPQAADMAIINRTARGDVVVTQDWGLAGLALAKGAYALSPWGHQFRDEEMDGRFAQRALHARLRRGGVRLPGPRRRTAADDEAFERSLRSLLFPST